MSAKNQLIRSLPILLFGSLLNANICFADSPLYAKGVAAMALNDLQAAIYDFDQAVTNDGTDWQSFLKRGQCLYQLGDYKLAIADFNQVISSKPKNVDAFLWRANSYAKLGQADKAANDYKQVLAIDPIKLAVISQRAMFSSNRQTPVDPDANPSSTNASATISAAAGAATTAPPVAQPPLHLRAALFAAGADPTKQISELSSAISLDPKNPQLLFRRARAYIQIRKNENAVNDLSDALMNNPNNASFYLARAFVYHLLGNDVLADEDIRQAQFCDPGLPKTIDFENPTTKSAVPMLDVILG